VVAGTAGAVHHRQQRRWDQQSADQQAEADATYQAGYQQAAAEQAAAAPQTPAQAEAPAARRLDEELRQLADLHTSGILTDEEFSTAKAGLLKDV
jgi:hypothetical protein